MIRKDKILVQTLKTQKTLREITLKVVSPEGTVEYFLERYTKCIFKRRILNQASLKNYKITPQTELATLREVYREGQEQPADFRNDTLRMRDEVEKESIVNVGVTLEQYHFLDMTFQEYLGTAIYDWEPTTEDYGIHVAVTLEHKEKGGYWIRKAFGQNHPAYENLKRLVENLEGWIEGGQKVSKEWMDKLWPLPKTVRLLGYWYDGDKYDQVWPDPKVFVDPTWDKQEKIAVWAHLQQGIVTRQTRGISHCRLCDHLLGSAELTDGVYIWPDGLDHYIKEHNVKPPQEFIDHVLSFERERWIVLHGLGQNAAKDYWPELDTHWWATQPKNNNREVYLEQERRAAEQKAMEERRKKERYNPPESNFSAELDGGGWDF